MYLSKQVLEGARRVYQETMTDDNRQVRDDTITPFAIAMKAEGYVAVSVPSGCTTLRECPWCKGKCSTKYDKDGGSVWGCPHCNRISLE